MVFGKDYETYSCRPLVLNCGELSFVSEWKYLGMTVVNGRHFRCSVKKCLASFYRAANTVLNVLKKPSEKVMLNL
jgi:hypothetical protein